MKSVKEAIKESGITSNVTQDDYPELEGEIITYFNGEEEKYGVVVGCNRSVGVTIVNVDNHNAFLVCCPGPIMPDHQEMIDEGFNYEPFFDATVSGIKAGYLSGNALTVAAYGKVEYSPNGVNGSHCAYRR